MKLKSKINIDFEEFFTNGAFDFLKLGNTKEWIINNFPDPDGLDEFPEVFYDDIWIYGNIELHFLNEELFLIFSDHIDELDGGNSLELKKWFLQDTDKLTLIEVVSQLNSKHIDFQKRTNRDGHLSISLELQSGIELGFYLEQKIDENYQTFLERSKNTNHNEFRLGSFSLMRK